MIFSMYFTPSLAVFGLAFWCLCTRLAFISPVRHFSISWSPCPKPRVPSSLCRCVFRSGEEDGDVSGGDLGLSSQGRGAGVLDTARSPAGVQPGQCRDSGRGANGLPSRSSHQTPPSWAPKGSWVTSSRSQVRAFAVARRFDSACGHRGGEQGSEHQGVCELGGGCWAGLCRLAFCAPALRAGGRQAHGAPEHEPPARGRVRAASDVHLGAPEPNRSLLHPRAFAFPTLSCGTTLVGAHKALEPSCSGCRGLPGCRRVPVRVSECA